MCRHIINAQVSISFVENKFYDCLECFAEQEGEEVDLSKVGVVVAMACKKCRQVFEKDLRSFRLPQEEECPHCGNRYVLPAMTPKSCLLQEATQRLELHLATFLREESLLHKVDREDDLAEVVLGDGEETLGHESEARVLQERRIEGVESLKSH